MKLYLKDHAISVWWNPNTDLAKTTFCLRQRLRVRLAWFEALKVEYQSLSFKSSISLYHLEVPSWNFDKSEKHTVWTIPFESNNKDLGLEERERIFSADKYAWPSNDSDMFTFKLGRLTIRRYLGIENERLTLIFLVRPE